ncbi:MAG TPA: BrnT family toxin [Roseiarcus sp.]|nr:BrnT family toxin [Roseiarcus sp.]
MTRALRTPATPRLILWPIARTAVATALSGPSLAAHFVDTQCNCKTWLQAVGSSADFEWHEVKRQKTLKERNLDFADAFQFYGRRVIHQPSPRDGEDRWKSTAMFDGHFFTVVWTRRGAALRIISMWRSHEQEQRRYREIFGS